jgi:hypothetical protein
MDKVCGMGNGGLMNSFKNYLIALLTGLLVLSLSAQSSSGASGTSASAKAIQYDHCLTLQVDPRLANTAYQYLDAYIASCAKYKP